MRYFLLIFCLIIVASCSKYETQFEGPTPLTSPPVNNNVKRPIVYAEDFLIGLTNNNLDTFSTLINSSARITGMAMNDAHDRVAYQTLNNNIRIIDLNGIFIKEISNTQNVVSFEYHSSGTLYMCDGAGRVTFDGTPLDIRSTNLKGYLTNANQILGMLIIGKNNVYCIYTAGSSSNVRHNLSSVNGNIDDETFRSVSVDLAYMRVFDYNQTLRDYKFYVRTYDASYGESTWEHSANNNLNGSLNYYRQSGNEVNMYKREGTNNGFSYEEGDDFYYFNGNRTFLWPNFSSRPRSIIYIDF